MKLNIVPARTGATWVRQGIRTFWRQPLALSGTFFLCMAAVSVAAMLPLLGTALALGLLPMATLLMMVASAQAMHGKAPTIALLAQTLRHGQERAPSMAALGLCYAAGFLLIVGVSALIDGGDFARLYLEGGRITPELAGSARFQAAMWCTMLLSLPLSLLFWHAPALVHWHHVPAIKSLFFSLVACMRNMGAFTVYGLVWFGVFLGGGLLASLVTALVIVLLGMGAGDSQAAIAFGGAVMLGTALVMAAMFFTSVVFTFRDCFQPPEKAAGTTHDDAAPPCEPR
ncbi:BPSS1780 family membrane protein [Ramlibacter sp. H39-3-26]|uniref:BPSS1780 family membrane protein n=1 Tax=Curvibacter soli TaxID=3031331 RepID=UPI0023DCCEBE|nr:BPSS1780 family membrane protein [Ramlibacter sp. H39-3-26]MDF1485021.1 BPSS1780 family membrane protein [Ramlibacter sp. H39-3-26]